MRLTTASDRRRRRRDCRPPPRSSYRPASPCRPAPAAGSSCGRHDEIPARLLLPGGGGHRTLERATPHGTCDSAMKNARAGRTSAANDRRTSPCRDQAAVDGRQDGRDRAPGGGSRIRLATDLRHRAKGRDVDDPATWGRCRLRSPPRRVGVADQDDLARAAAMARFVTPRRQQETSSDFGRWSRRRHRS